MRSHPEPAVRPGKISGSRSICPGRRRFSPKAVPRPSSRTAGLGPSSAFHALFSPFTSPRAARHVRAAPHAPLPTRTASEIRPEHTCRVPQVCGGYPHAARPQSANIRPVTLLRVMPLPERYGLRHGAGHWLSWVVRGVGRQPVRPGPHQGRPRRVGGRAPSRCDSIAIGERERGGWCVVVSAERQVLRFRYWLGRPRASRHG